MRKLTIIVIAGTFLLGACSMSGSLKSKRAVQGAIEAHLRGNKSLSMQNFKTEVEKVSFKDDTADALAKFVAKGSSQTVVEVRYQLKLEGNHWKVVSSHPVGQGMGGHGSMGGAMGGHGGMGGSSMGMPSAPQKSTVPMEPSH